MPDQHRDVAKGLNPRTVRTAQGQLRVPDDWDLLPPGDPGLTFQNEDGAFTINELTSRMPFKVIVVAGRLVNVVV